MLADTSAQPAHAYLALSAALFGVWLVLYLARRAVRREMVRVSVGTMLLGLTEPLFVPEYWNPPTLWAGVPLEELMFAFTFGLYWSSVYEHFTWHRLARPASLARAPDSRSGPRRAGSRG